MLLYAVGVLNLGILSRGRAREPVRTPAYTLARAPQPHGAVEPLLKGEMTAERAIRAESWRRLPPAGDPISAAERAAGLADPDPAGSLCGGLRRELGAEEIHLFASGRAALRDLLVWLAARSGRREVVVPAYCCFSVPAAVVAAGLRVRLVDVDARGAIDAGALAALPLESAAALLVANLFGFAEPIEPLRAIAQRAGVALIDDAAQALGAESAEGRAGSRGDVGLLSFGRGKPLSGLGGGALVWPRRPQGFPAPAHPAPARRAAQIRARSPMARRCEPEVFRWLAALPGLHVGETRFDPAFATGPIDGASLVLCAARLPRIESLAKARAARAKTLAALLREHTRFTPLLAPPGARGVYPRLAVLAPNRATRTAALARLASAGVGASGFYPSALGEIAALRPFLDGADRQPGAEDLASRILTLPTHAGADEPTRARITSLLSKA